MCQCWINRDDSLVSPAPLWIVYDRISPITRPVQQEQGKSTAHTGHFFTAAISKFIEIDWFLQIIVKLILPLNMKLERGLGGQWPVPTSKREAHGWL